MAMKIVESCISCGNCEPDCPNDAITAGDGIYLIDPALCTECVGFAVEPTCAQVCPVADTIISDPEHAESREVLEEKYRRLHAA